VTQGHLSGRRYNESSGMQERFPRPRTSCRRYRRHGQWRRSGPPRRGGGSLGPSTETVERHFGSSKLRVGKPKDGTDDNLCSVLVDSDCEAVENVLGPDEQGYMVNQEMLFMAAPECSTRATYPGHDIKKNFPQPWAVRSGDPKKGSPSCRLALLGLGTRNRIRTTW